jgi:3-methyladenine DNA glycosylase AlkD
MPPSDTTHLTAAALLEHLHTLANPHHQTGMARFGINAAQALGISIPTLRTIAKNIKTSTKHENVHRHLLAQDLWESGIHEAQILAILIEDPMLMPTTQIESWVRDVDSWDICDQLCSNLLWRIPYAEQQITTWCADDAEFVRRVGIVMIAIFAVHDKKADDARFEMFFPLLEQYAYDERNFVKKAVNWSLRQLGKRSAALLHQAVACAERIKAQNTSSARWIASDALREFAKLPDDYFSKKKISSTRLAVVGN